MTDEFKTGDLVEKHGGRYGGPGRIVGVTEDLGDGYRLYDVAMKVEGGYGEFVHVFPASVLRPLPAALAAMPQPVAVAVKPLEWARLADGSFSGTSEVGQYVVYPSGRWFSPACVRSGEEPNVEAAKAAANADHERRIRSCLTTPAQGAQPSEEVTGARWATPEERDRDQDQYEADLKAARRAVIESWHILGVWLPYEERRCLAGEMDDGVAVQSAFIALRNERRRAGGAA